MMRDCAKRRPEQAGGICPARGASGRRLPLFATQSYTRERGRASDVDARARRAALFALTTSACRGKVRPGLFGKEIAPRHSAQAFRQAFENIRNGVKAQADAFADLFQSAAAPLHRHRSPQLIGGPFSLPARIGGFDGLKPALVFEQIRLAHMAKMPFGISTGLREIGHRLSPSFVRFEVAEPAPDEQRDGHRRGAPQQQGYEPPHHAAASIRSSTARSPSLSEAIRSCFHAVARKILMANARLGWRTPFRISLA